MKTPVLILLLIAVSQLCGELVGGAMVEEQGTLAVGAAPKG